MNKWKLLLTYHWVELILCFLSIGLSIAVFAQMMGEQI